MATDAERSVLAVALASLFSRADAETLVAESFPASVQRLFAAVLGSSEWRASAVLAGRALCVIAALTANSALRAELDADVAAGWLGLGAGDDAETDAAIRAVEESLGAASGDGPSTGSGTGGGDGPSTGSGTGGGDGPSTGSGTGWGDGPSTGSGTGGGDGPSTGSGTGGGDGPSTGSGTGGDSSPAIEITTEWTPESAYPMDISDATLVEPIEDVAPADGGADAYDPPPAFDLPWSPPPEAMPADDEVQDVPDGADPDGGAPGAGDRITPSPKKRKPTRRPRPSKGDGASADRVVHPWLNARLDDGGEALLADTRYELAVSFDAEALPGAIADRAEIAIPARARHVELTVHLVSNDFAVPARPRRLRVDADGHSAAPAVFRVTPRHPGRSRIAVIITRRGSFLQRLDLVYDVGGDAGAIETTTTGRPVVAATVVKPREVLLHITRDDGKYQIAAPAWSTRFVEVHATPESLAQLGENTRAVLLDWVSRPRIASGITLTEADSRAFLKDLAERGFEMQQTLFEGPGASDDLRDLGRWLRGKFAEGTTVLQVMADDFTMPWPLMYFVDRYDPRAASWENFFGARHIVEHIPYAKIATAPGSERMASTPELTVHTVYNTDIDRQITPGPITAQRAFWQRAGVTVRETTTRDDFATTALDPAAGDQLLYLYCHAVDVTDDPEQTKLIFTGDKELTLRKMRIYYPTSDRFTAQPIVFLNACETAQLSARFYDSFVAYFQDKGARGVIGTECRAPGAFASAFAQAFFDELLGGMPLGEAMLTVRRRFLSEHRNPLGLLYAVYCDPDIVITPALPARQA